MKVLLTMVDRSCWDQSFVDVDAPSLSHFAVRRSGCADNLILDDVFAVSDSNCLPSTPESRKAIVRKSTSCSDEWSSHSAYGDSGCSGKDTTVDELHPNDCCELPTLILCSSSSSSSSTGQQDSGTTSSTDERVYQNGNGWSSELQPATTSNDLILLDSGTFSDSCSSCSRTPPEPPSTTGGGSCVDVDQSWMTSTAAGAAYSRVASFLPSWDSERLQSAYRRLASCGFYYGRMTIDEATRRLSRRPVGTFLLRDSSDRRYLFSLSVQTCRGTTSIRMSYRSGLFRLDCTVDQEHLLPTFDCPLRLIAHYVRMCSAATRRTSKCNGGDEVPPRRNSRHGYVLLESSGRKDTPVLLITPYREQPTGLAQLCRRTVHRALAPDGSGAGDASVDRLQLLPSLKTYLKDYPFDL